MPEYDLYLETAAAGEVTVHLLDPLGYQASGASRAQAEVRLRRQLEAVTTAAPIIFSLKESLTGIRPLFTPEREPVGRAELIDTVALMAQNRATLLALVRPLVPAMRNWRPTAARMRINDVLQHVADSELWYMSRLVGEVDPDGRPQVMTFLQTSRAQVIACLQSLSERQRSEVVTQPWQARFPDEAWSLRKVLRRLLEHEREHIFHIEEILAEWRRHYQARLTAERAAFFFQLRGLGEETLSEAEIMPGWTVKDLICHTAFYDAFHANRMELVADGRVQEIQEIGDDEALALYNAARLAEFKPVPWQQAIAMLLKERSSFQQTLKRLADSDLQRPVRLPWGWRTSMRAWATWRYRHDAEHGGDIATWRQSLPREKLRDETPKTITRAMLQATRKAFLSLLPLLPESEWTTRPVCGEWTVKDLLGHLTDWEIVAVSGLRQLAAGETPEFDVEIPDFDSFNNDQAALRKDQSWADVWQSFHDTRAELLHFLNEASAENLVRTFRAPWGATVDGTYWPIIWAGHELEHAVDVRAALALANWPRRLTSHAR